MKYILDVSKLNKFDIILTKNKKIPSRLIRYFTASDYSHASIYMLDYSIIEATREGRVFSQNTQRLIFDNIDDCKVLRYKNTLINSDKSTLDFFLRSSISTRYSISEAYKTLDLCDTDEEAKKREQFCSRLVAQAFSEIKIKLVNNVDYCSPEQLNSSELLETVPNVIRIATEAEIAFAKTRNPIKDNQIQNYLWLDNVAKLAKKENFEIISQNDVEKFLMKYPEYDRQVCNFINKTSYLSQYKVDEVMNPPRYKYYLNVNLNIEQELSSNISLIHRHLISYSNCQLLYKKTGLNYFLILKKLYKNLLNQCNRRLNVLEKYIQRYLTVVEEFDIQILASYISKIEELKTEISTLFNQDGYKKYL